MICLICERRIWAIHKENCPLISGKSDLVKFEHCYRLAKFEVGQRVRTTLEKNGPSGIVVSRLCSWGGWFYDIRFNGEQKQVALGWAESEMEEESKRNEL